MRYIILLSVVLASCANLEASVDRVCTSTQVQVPELEWESVPKIPGSIPASMSYTYRLTRDLSGDIPADLDTGVPGIKTEFEVAIVELSLSLPEGLAEMVKVARITVTSGYYGEPETLLTVESEVGDGEIEFDISGIGNRELEAIKNSPVEIEINIGSDNLSIVNIEYGFSLDICLSARFRASI